MKFTVTLTLYVERLEGMNASADEVEAELMDVIDGAMPLVGEAVTVYIERGEAEHESEYEITAVDVEGIEQA